VIFWGTYFPLISEAVTGQEASVGAPWFDRYTVPLALILVLLSGIGPVIAWRRATFANARRNFLAPITVALCTLLVLLLGGVREKPFAITMFCCAAFALASVGQEFWRGVRVRRAMASEPAPLALLALVRRNRRRYGGYIVHIGMAVLFIGVAASSSFEHQNQRSLGVGQSTHVGPYEIHYLRATAHVEKDPAHTGSTLNLGAVLRVTKHGHYVAMLNPSEGFYDSGEVAQGSVGHLIAGQPVSHISMSAGLTRDVWSAIEPNISIPALQKIIEAGNKTIPLVRPDEGLIAIAYMAHAYLQHPPPAQFNFIDSPLVMWIWIGGLIVLGGGLVVLWPAPSVVRRRVSERSRARAARGLARA
jgi:cytochrome c-type biogenesis protein CcmF